MSLLRDRLNRHLKGGSGEKSVNSDEQCDKSDELAEHPITTIEVKGGVEETEAGGEWSPYGMHMETNESGTFLMRLRRYPLPYYHGNVELSELLETGSELLALTAGEAVEPGKVLFLDTETTGLGIGAGNVPFMIGIGYYAPGAFVVEQLFIRNLAEELAMLTYLDDRLSMYTHLVTYNGRSFDWPIVKSRFVLNRIPLQAEQIGQLDFLYPARSLWRTVLSACRLSVVEEERLGFVREDDVPGSQAPALYFRFLAEHDPKVVFPVFTHNENDILSLAGLAVHLSHALAGRLAYTEMGEEELFRTGVWLNKRGKPQLSDALFGELLNREGEEKAAYFAAIAPIYKRRGDEEKAALLWQEAIDAAGDSFGISIEPWIELAMLFEHKKRSAATALTYAEQARDRLLKRLAIMPAAETKTHAQLMELEKRISRLRRKQIASRAGSVGIQGELFLLE